MFRRFWCVLPFFLISCSDSPPGPPPPPRLSTIQVAADDIGVTEAWLKVTLTDTNQPRTIALRRDGQIISNVQLTGTDTVLVDVGLAPNHTYRYASMRMQDSTIVDTASLQLTTMDTTSHDFVWQVDTIGVSSSLLRDIAILSSNGAWATGELFLRDSAGNRDPVPYNLVQWDGVDWVPGRVLFPICDQNGNEVGTAPFGANTLLAFTPSDTWMTEGGSVVRWNGTGFARECLPPGIILGELMRFSNRYSLTRYAVGRAGTVIRSNGTTWQGISSGTDVDLLDAWESENGSLWACGYRSNYSESILLRYNGSAWEEYGHSPPWGVYADLFGSVWCYKNDSAYVVGNLGVFRHAQSSSTGFRRIPLELGYFPYKIRGSARNDIVIVGDQGMIWHFNGLTWKRFDQLIDSEARLHSAAIRGDQIIAVGYRFYNAIERQALVYHGRR